MQSVWRRERSRVDCSERMRGSSKFGSVAGLRSAPSLASVAGPRSAVGPDSVASPRSADLGAARSRRLPFLALVLLSPLTAHEVAAQQSQATVAEDPFRVIGFADIDYDSTDARGREGFSLGQAVAHVIAPLGERINLFSEISATAHDSNYSIEIERLIVKYDFSNEQSLSGGRYHTPIGYWNTAFHHGTWLQTTAGRPEVVKFGSQLVPIHFVGLLFQGKASRNRPGLAYEIGLGNGRHSNVARAGDAGDINGERAWSVSVHYEPPSFNGVNAGLGIYSDRVSPPGGVDFDEKIYSAYFALERETPEIIAEYIHSDHELTHGPGPSGGMDSYYVQLAYRLGGNLQRLKPYLRAEHTVVDDEDPLFAGSDLDYKGVLGGLRFDFASFASLKFEYHNERFGTRPRDNSVIVQLSVVLARD